MAPVWPLSVASTCGRRAPLQRLPQPSQCQDHVSAQSPPSPPRHDSGLQQGCVSAGRACPPLSDAWAAQPAARRATTEHPVSSTNISAHSVHSPTRNTLLGGAVVQKVEGPVGGHEELPPGGGVLIRREGRRGRGGEHGVAHSHGGSASGGSRNMPGWDMQTKGGPLRLGGVGCKCKCKYK